MCVSQHSLPAVRTRQGMMNERDEAGSLRWEHAQEPVEKREMRRTALSTLAPALAAVIDSSTLGVALVGARGEVLWVNRALEVRARSGTPLRIDSGRLHFQPRKGDAEFQEVLASVCSGLCPIGLLAHHLPRKEGRARATIQIAVVRLHTSEAAAAVYVVEPFHSAPDHELLRRLHGLTRMEARLASELLQGVSMSEAAQKLGMSLGTARTHLKALFAKTHTSRQADLVRLLGSGLARLDLRLEGTKGLP